jgi:hypothetical protein
MPDASKEIVVRVHTCVGYPANKTVLHDPFLVKVLRTQCEFSPANNYF